MYKVDTIRHKIYNQSIRIDKDGTKLVNSLVHRSFEVNYCIVP